MAIQQNSKITWSDVKSIYTNLNKDKEDRSTSGNTQYYGGRTNFGFSNVTIPEQATKGLNLSDLSVLNAFIKEMSSNSYLTNIAKGVNLPEVGSKALPSFLNDLSEQVQQITETCVFNPFSSCFGFDPDFCFSSDFCFSTNFSTQGTCFGSCFGSCFSFGSDMSCATHSCSSSYGTCSGDGCSSFGCSEQCSGGI